jgi:uncharacterized protein (DUF433 family)/DNA-binding transcriptional MerR regulator
MNTGLTPPSYVADDGGYPILTFEDLISLEVVRRLRHEGASLQAIRRVEEYLRSECSFDRPFAYKVFFTDGAAVWAQVEGDEDSPIVIEVSGRRKHHYAWREAIATFAEDIRFEGPDLHASKWAITPWVEIDPEVQFGAPVVAGTRIPVRTIVTNLKAGTPEDVADWYGLSIAQVKGARDYVALN